MVGLQAKLLGCVLNDDGLMRRRSHTVTEDAMIAATVIVRRLTVVTRNVRDFRQIGVELLNPFEGVTR